MTAEQFKAHRLKIGWTQKQAATALGVTVLHISAIELGRRKAGKTIAKLFSFYQLGDGPDAPSWFRDRFQ